MTPLALTTAVATITDAMTLHFIFVLTWIIPDLKGLSRSEIESIVEAARLSSIPRIRKYAGYSLTASFLIPAAFFIFISTSLNLWLPEMHFFFNGMTVILSILFGLFLMSFFYSLILKPAIHDGLNKKSEC